MSDRFGGRGWELNRNKFKYFPKLKNPAVNDDVEMRIFKIFNNRNCFLPKEPATTTATTDIRTNATALQLSLRSRSSAFSRNIFSKNFGKIKFTFRAKSSLDATIVYNFN